MRLTFDPQMVRQLFDYRDGDLIWKPRGRDLFPSDWAWKVWNTRYAGTVAGYRRGDGYRTVRIKIAGLDSPVRASRLIWVWHYGEWPILLLDHIDHDRGNDRIENLREVNDDGNCKNKSLLNVGKAGVFGVSFDDRYDAWNARIQSGGQVFHLGSFTTKPEAIAARRAAEKIFGFHPNHGS